jgi:hypothetical protein
MAVEPSVRPSDLLEQWSAMRTMIELLRRVMTRRGTGDGFRLRDASVPGEGIRPELRSASWEQIRDSAYDSSPL